MISEAIFEANVAEAARKPFTLEDGITRFRGSTGLMVKKKRAFEILKARASGMMVRHIAKAFRVSHHTISALAKNRPELWEKAKAEVAGSRGANCFVQSVFQKGESTLYRVSAHGRKQFCGPITETFLKDIITNLWPVDLSAQDSGLYFLYLDNQVVYIGQSTCVAKRTAQHLSDKINPKTFNRAMYVPMSRDLLLTAERAAIRIFYPQHNISQTGARPSRLY
jgi:hypothetical protein